MSNTKPAANKPDPAQEAADSFVKQTAAERHGLQPAKATKPAAGADMGSTGGTDAALMASGPSQTIEAKMSKKELRVAELNDLERITIAAYAEVCKAAGKPVVLRFMLRSGKPLPAVLVEVGTFCYVVTIKVEGKPTKMILHKHAVDYYLLGGDE